MLFEKATANDINSLVELRTEYLLEDYGEIPQDKLSLISRNLPPYFNSHLNNDLFAFICRDDDIIAGCCFLYVSEKPSNPSFINGKTGTVMNVYTRPQYRRKGIAVRLMKMMLAEAERMCLDFVELKSTEDGYSLYRSVGFEDVVSKYHNMKYIIDNKKAE